MYVNQKIKIMNNKILGLGLGIFLSIAYGFDSSILAEKNIAVGSQNITRNIISISPVDLVDSAYQGRLAKFDIPSHGKFITAIKSNRVDSKLLVESAISSGRLAPETINDRSYLNSVRDVLKLKIKDN